jgi:hypothetical protein
MPRHEYRGATPETKAALTGHVGEIAYEAGFEDAYLYGILSGSEPDPVKRFKHFYRAVCRKNPEGARGILAKLTLMFREESPQKAEAVGMGDAMRTFADVMAVSAELDEGLCPPEKFEAAKQAHAETVERVTVYPASAHLRNAG